MKFVIETTKEKFSCSELTLKDYKELLKCLFGEKPKTEVFVETVSEILSKLTNKSTNFFIKELNIIDFVLLLIQLRISSQGEVIDLSVTKEEKQMNLELNLNYVLEEIKKTFGPFSNASFKYKNINIFFGMPTLNKMLQGSSEEDHLLFLNKILVNSTEFTFETIDQAKQIFDCLPPLLGIDVLNKFQELLKITTETNFLKKYGITDQKLTFVPNLDFLINFSKLLFNEPLDVFYDNLFCLSYYGKLNLSYISTLTPGEYVYMLKRLEQTIASQNTPKQTVDSSDTEAMDGFDSGMFE